jgi:hypothetical protein
MERADPTTRFNGHAMTTEQFKNAMRAVPFLPFVLRTADGREFRVDHPEGAWPTPQGRTVFIATGEGDAAIAIDLLLVTSLEPVTAKP